VFPKRESPSIPSIRAVSWDVRFFLRAKIEHISLSFRPFEAAFSGIGRDSRFAGACIFLYFFRRFKLLHFLNRQIK